MPYKVLLHPKVIAALDALPAPESKRVRSALAKLADDPHASRSGMDIQRLQGVRGKRDLFRIRVGELRAIYAIEGREVLVTDLFRRGAGYEI